MFLLSGTQTCQELETPWERRFSLHGACSSHIFQIHSARGLRHGEWHLRHDGAFWSNCWVCNLLNWFNYFVPAQLRSPTPEDLGEEEPPSWDPCPLYLDFLSGYVPHGFFSKLVSRCIRWCSDNKFEELPLLFLGAAKFFIGKPVSHHFTFVCKKRFIKIVVNQIESDDRELSMAGEDDVCSLVRKFLEDTLKDMKLNLPWLSNLEYRLSVACPLCPERMCFNHDQVSCTHEDCLCLREMAPPGKQLFCRESRKPFMVSQLDKWFFTKSRIQVLCFLLTFTKNKKIFRGGGGALLRLLYIRVTAW